jgi:pyridoxal/pyridoxine/pyridoxamine kinase
MEYGACAVNFFSPVSNRQPKSLICIVENIQMFLHDWDVNKETKFSLLIFGFLNHHGAIQTIKLVGAQ